MMSWTKSMPGQQRWRGGAAAVLACVLALLVLMVVDESIKTSDSVLQECADGAFCPLKTAASWAKTVIAKVSVRQHPSFVLPDISATEQAIEAANEASSLFTMKGHAKSSSDSNQYPVHRQVASSSGSERTIFPSAAMQQAAEQDLSSPEGTEDRTPPEGGWEGPGQHPSSETSLNLPSQADAISAPSAEMVEVPMPFENQPFNSPTIRRAVVKYVRAREESSRGGSEGENQQPTASANIKQAVGYRINRITVNVPLPPSHQASASVDQAFTEDSPAAPSQSTEPSDTDAASDESITPATTADSHESVSIDQPAPVPEQTPSPISEDDVQKDNVNSGSAEVTYDGSDSVLWTYVSPETGPDEWGSLGYSTCSEGIAQSPINIEANVRPASLQTLAWGIPETSDAFQTSNSAVEALYNGRTFEVTGLDALMSLEGVEYTLKQLHVHTPSEHKISGQHFDMEIHFVHSAIVDGSTRYMIVAAFFHLNSESARFIAEIAALLPSLRAQGVLHLDFAAIAMSVLGQMEPVNPTVTNAQNYFQYEGSFTAPPCDEGVTWIVLKNALPISKGDLQAFVQLQGKNNRPVQALHDRVVFDSHLAD